MPTAKPSESDTFTGDAFRKSFETFDQEYAALRIQEMKNNDIVMAVPYAMMLPRDKDTDTISFRVFLDTKDGIAPATLRVTSDQIVDPNFEPYYSPVHDFMNCDRNLTECEGVFGRVVLDAMSTCSLEPEGRRMRQDWPTKLTTEELTTRIFGPNEQWYHCVMWDVMDAQEKIAKANARTPIATDDFTDTDTFDQPSF